MESNDTPLMTPPTSLASSTLANYDRNALRVLYAANVVQLLQGLVITFVNAVVATSVISRYTQKNSTNILLGNICFANLVVGVMISVANVLDGSDEVNLVKTESALAVVNCFVNIATMLALTTNTFVGVRNPNYQMSSKNCMKLIFAIWFTVLSLCFVKAIVFAFDGLGYTNVCYTCYAVFEIVALMIFSVAAGLFFAAAFYLILVRKKRTVSDPSTTAPESRNSDFRFFITTGIFLAVYFVCFMLFIFMYLAWLAKPRNVTPGLADVILSIFLLHAIINPIILAIRHKEFRSVMQQVFCCKAAVAALANDDEQLAQNGSHSHHSTNGYQYQGPPRSYGAAGPSAPAVSGENGFQPNPVPNGYPRQHGTAVAVVGDIGIANSSRDLSPIPSVAGPSAPTSDGGRMTPHPLELPPLRLEANEQQTTTVNPVSTV